MKKKFILTLGTVSAVVAPVVAAISCHGNHNGNKKPDKPTNSTKSKPKYTYLSKGLKVSPDGKTIDVSEIFGNDAKYKGVTPFSSLSNTSIHDYASSTYGAVSILKSLGETAGYTNAQLKLVADALRVLMVTPVGIPSLNVTGEKVFNELVKIDAANRDGKHIAAAITKGLSTNIQTVKMTLGVIYLTYAKGAFASFLKELEPYAYLNDTNAPAEQYEITDRGWIKINFELTGAATINPTTGELVYFDKSKAPNYTPTQPMLALPPDKRVLVFSKLDDNHKKAIYYITKKVLTITGKMLDVTHGLTNSNVGLQLSLVVKAMSLGLDITQELADTIAEAVSVPLERKHTLDDLNSTASTLYPNEEELELRLRDDMGHILWLFMNDQMQKDN